MKPAENITPTGWSVSIDIDRNVSQRELHLVPPMRKDVPTRRSKAPVFDLRTLRQIAAVEAYAAARAAQKAKFDSVESSYSLFPICVPRATSTPTAHSSFSDMFHCVYTFAVSGSDSSASSDAAKLAGDN